MNSLSPHAIEMFTTIVLACIGSSGFWMIIQKRIERKDARSQMILGLGHDRIIYLCQTYIDRGWLDPDEYDNLYNYLYKPYRAMGGNGTAERMMNEVNKLPIKSKEKQTSN